MPHSPRFTLVLARLAPLALLAACMAYQPAGVPTPRSDEVVRFAFSRPRSLVVRRDGTTVVDTLPSVGAVYGRVLRLDADSVVLQVTKISRYDRVEPVPRGRTASVAWASTRGMERVTYLPARTAWLGVAVVALATWLVGSFASGIGGS